MSVSRYETLKRYKNERDFPPITKLMKYDTGYAAMGATATTYRYTEARPVLKDTWNNWLLGIAPEIMYDIVRKTEVAAATIGEMLYLSKDELIGHGLSQREAYELMESEEGKPAPNPTAIIVAAGNPENGYSRPNGLTRTQGRSFRDAWRLEAGT